MPNSKNAKKALRQTKKRTLANLQIKKAYKQAIKQVEKAVVNKEDTAEKLRLAQKKLDKAAKKGVIKKNTAGRKLSRLVKKLPKTK